MKTMVIGIWRRVFRLSGAHGIVALVLAGAALLVATWIPTLISQGDALQAAIQAKAKFKVPPTPVAVVSRMPVGQQIGEFVSAFPPFSNNSEDLQEVFLSAKRHNLLLPRGDYQLKQDPKAPLVIFTATLPLSADYAAIKDFTADVLRTVPNVSMDELRMTRNTAGNNQLESVVRFSFVYRRP